jgi:hypothetical protein
VVIAGLSVPAYGEPVERFRRRPRLGSRNRLVMPFRVRPLFAHERNAPESKLQVRLKLGFRQIAFDPEALDATGIHHDHGWRPNRVEAVKPDGMLLDVGFYRKEIVVDKAGDFFVGIRLGLQPSASASSGSRAEIEQNRLISVFRAG